MASSTLASDFQLAWKRSLNQIQSSNAARHQDQNQNQSQSQNALQNLVSIGRAWSIVQNHFNSLSSPLPSNSIPVHVVEAIRLLSAAGQGKALSTWYLGCLEKQLPQRLQHLLSPLSTSYQSTSTTRASSIKNVCESIVLDWKQSLSPISQHLFGSKSFRDLSTFNRTYQAILHSTISQTPAFQISLLQTLFKDFLTSLPQSHTGFNSSNESGNGLSSLRLISNLVTLGLGPFLLMQFNEIAHSKIKAKVIALADDGTWKSWNSTSNKTHSEIMEELEGDEVLEVEEENFEAVGTSGSALPSLQNWLNQILIPSLKAWIDAVESSTSSNVSQMKLMGSEEAEENGVESVRLSNLDSKASEEQSTKGMQYHMFKTLCEIRSLQLFDLVADWPESKPSLLDLKECLYHSELKNSVTVAYSHALRTRLLHSGAGTQDIIQIYVHTIRSLREIDPSGVILSLIVSPIRTYLRGRKDTISVIVSGLIGQGGSTLLRQELEVGIHQKNNDSNSITLGSLDSNENAAKTAGIKNAEDLDDDDDDDGDDEEENGKVDWEDENWEPKPVDAGPNYKMSKNQDIINILITIFDDRMGFVKALEQTTAESLIRVKGYNSDREYRNNIILKRRFGSEAIGHCDVMLSDLTMSRRIDTSIHILTQSTLRNHGLAPSLSLPHPTGLSSNEISTLNSLHPLILSKQFWPEIQGESSTNSNQNQNQIQNQNNGESNELQNPNLGSGIGIGSGKGTDSLLMPGQFERVMKVYENYYSNIKDTRKLKWLVNIGRIKLELEMEDGRIIKEEVTPLQAAVVELASEGSASRSNPLSSLAASQALNVEKAAALNALYFWSSKGVLRELQSDPGSFEILEENEKSSLDLNRREKDEDVMMED